MNCTNSKLTTIYC